VLSLACIVDFFTEFDLAKWRVSVVDSELCEGGGLTFFGFREIDIFEGVNLSPSSQMGLHTTAGCAQVSPNQTSGIVNGTNCEGAVGCITTNDSPASYGQAFADAQGGVFVAELATSGVS